MDSRLETRVKTAVPTASEMKTKTQRVGVRGQTRAKNFGFSLGLGATKTM